MNSGEALTRATIWLALLCYFISVVLQAQRKSENGARWFWTIGCACYVAHVVAAFHFFHDWSHAAAYADTARQTGEVTGWKWGGGIYINYLFTLVWVGDALWWWGNSTSHAMRPKWIDGAWHGFFLFMIFNGTVVFGQGSVRWFGLAGIIAVAAAWARGRRRANGSSAPAS